MVALGACTPKETAETAPQETSTVITWPPPTVAILSPEDGASVPAGDVEVVVALTGYTLSEVPLSSSARVPAPRPGQAHHEVNEPPHGLVVWSLDGVEVDATATDRYTISGVAAGPHTLSVELVYPDRDAFYPPVEDQVDVTVP